MTPRENPFASHRVTSLPFVAPDDDWTALRRSLEALHYRGALVGPCGTGKTTLLERLVRELENEGRAVHFYRLNDQNRNIGPDFWQQNWLPNHALLIDGAEQLSPLVWWRIWFKARHASVFVITTHRSGLFPLWHRTQSSPQLLERLCWQLGQPLSADEARVRWQESRGNIREAFLRLYDEKANLRNTPCTAPQKRVEFSLAPEERVSNPGS